MITIKEHYKFHSRKSIKPYSRLLLILFMVITVFFTYARYIDNMSGNTLVQIAKWSILVNGENISNNQSSLTNSIQLINSSDGTTSIDAGDTCYFDLVITPITTETALTYSISVDLTDTNCNLPYGTQITSYQKYIGSNETLNGTVTVNNTSTTITENISLTNAQALDNTTIRKYRIYCQIPALINSTQNQQYNIVPSITIQQTI